MAVLEAQESRSVGANAICLLLTPLAVSIAIGVAALAFGGREAAALDSGRVGLLLLGPAVPIYLVWIPLFPFALRALRRGWVPSRWRVVVGTLLVALAFDAVFWLSRP